MRLDIDELRKGFFKKSLSVGYHNTTYSWTQIMLIIINCIRGLESLEEGAKSPSAQTVRDRLLLDGEWDDHFHKGMWKIALWAVKRFQRLRWYVSIDETHIPFFGKRKRLNKQLVKQGFGNLVHGYRAKTPGATGSFCFLVVSLCCSRIRIPIAIKMVGVGEDYELWLETVLKRLFVLVPQATLLADRGFGNRTWFYQMLERLDIRYVVRIPLRKKENKNKVANGADRFQYWMTDSKTKEKVLLTVAVVKDGQERVYFFAHNLVKTGKYLLHTYTHRWDLENIFKDCDRAELPTSTRNPRMRLYSVMLSFFLFTLWQAEKSITKKRQSLRSFIKSILEKICNIIRCSILPEGRIIRPP